MGAAKTVIEDGRDGPCGLPARMLAQRIKSKKVSAAEALDAHLEQIEKHNGALHAVVSLDVEQARKRAKAADAALARGEVWGPLHGVPMTLKDAHDAAGLRTTVGTKLFDRVAKKDGTVAARLRAAGANIIGHTNVAPFLADYQSANPIFGRTANPWDTKRTPGGSSGGAAAALAAGMTPLEIGSDLAGSVRLPAHFCGIYGLKTTEHRVPLTGFFRQPEETPRTVRIMTCLGPMARNLDDLELALSIVAGPDAHDGDVPPVPLGSRSAHSVKDLRLAVAPTLPGVTVARSLVELVERVAARCSDRGARVEATLPDVDWGNQLALFGDLVQAITGLFDPGAKLRDEQRSLAWYFSCLERRDRFIAAWEAFFVRFDALLLPPGIASAFPHCENGDRIVVDGKHASYNEHGRLLVPFNLTGHPALIVPAGQDGDGLPIGLQLVGPLWSETSLLDIARALEEASILPGFRAPPGYS
jgi:amidase